MRIGIMEIAILAILAAILFAAIWWFSSGNDKDQG